MTAAARCCFAALLIVFPLLHTGCSLPAEGEVHAVIPVPTTYAKGEGEPFRIDVNTQIVFDAGDADGERIGHFLSDLVGNTVELMPRVVSSDSAGTGPTVRLSRSADLAGEEAYEIEITTDLVTVRASGAAGLFYGVQTIRQLLPALVEYTAAYPNPLSLAPAQIEDEPRFAWRGLMLDVARHFLPVEDVKRFVDLMALYKLNRLHLHLSDDQGWRIEIPSRPLLTSHGSTTQVGGKGGGYYTTAEYAELVQYAAERFVTVVPEIDLPGHTNAALASYPELNCDGRPRSRYTGTEVGFSSVCVEKETTYDFISDVVGDIARLTTGPYFHMGGDEVQTLSDAQYVTFVERVQEIIASYGKQLVGWDEVAAANLRGGSRVQLWRPLWPTGGDVAELDSARAEAAAALRMRIDRSVAAGVHFIASPADRIYLDMKYDTSTVLGLSWAGVNDVQDAYDWDISDVFDGIPDAAIAGVEATIWSESLGKVRDFEYMAFPRLPGVAELGWSAADQRIWETYRERLAAHETRWIVLGVNYRRSPLVPWAEHPRP